MKPASAKTFTGVTEEKIGQIRDKARTEGVDLKADNGQQNYDHCQIVYAYDKQAQTLTVTPSLPFYIPETTFWGHFTNWLGLIPA